MLVLAAALLLQPVPSHPLKPCVCACVRFRSQLCQPGSVEKRRHDGKRHLQAYVDAEARNLGSEFFAKFIDGICRRTEALLRKE